MLQQDKSYWENRYKNNEIGWDIGFISTPIKQYINQLSEKNSQILIPGGGNCYELEYLFNNGFKNACLIDWSKTAIQNFKNRVPNFPDKQLFCDDFFSHEGQYDLIFEQTFFCALYPNQRQEYVQKMHKLLKPSGKLVGLLFNKTFETNPPYGGNKNEYQALFGKYFEIITMEECYNSIVPRAGSELFVICIKK